jgi:hypothetical protein
VPPETRVQPTERGFVQIRRARIFTRTTDKA